MNAPDFFYKTKGFFKEIARSEIVLQAVLVGLISGILVILFKESISWLFDFIQFKTGVFPFSYRLLLFPLITTLGGLVAGILVFKVAPETRGSGIPYVKLTLARIGRGTRLRSIAVKFFAGVAGIGTGLSLGREGPSVQLGAGSGALVAKIFRMKGTNQDKLIASGAGAAIAATFNAPIAGAIFVLEELIQKFSPALLFSVLVSTVSAAGIARYFLGDNPSFVIPQLSFFVRIEDIWVFILLGVVAGVVGVCFCKMIFFNITLFEKMTVIPQWAKPAVAGFFVGVFGLFLPYILGSGNLAVDMLLAGKFGFLLILIIFVGKFVATPFCFASGAAGGIFLPTLMLGAFLGYFLSSLCIFCGIELNPAVFALVGMGAFLAAVARTPITAVVMVFEMTGDYNHILPIMLSVAISDLVAEKLGSAPIYTSLIFRQGPKSREAAMLSEVKVEKIMSREVEQFSHSMSIEEAFEIMQKTHHGAYPVVSDKKKLTGIITFDDIEDAFLQGISHDENVEKIMNPNPVTVYPDEDIYRASYLLHTTDTEWLVVEERDKRVAGIITRYDINKFLEEKTP